MKIILLQNKKKKKSLNTLFAFGVKCSAVTIFHLSKSGLLAKSSDVPGLACLRLCVWK